MASQKINRMDKQKSSYRRHHAFTGGKASARISTITQQPAIFCGGILDEMMEP
jgi:hypothetical protein